MRNYHFERDLERQISKAKRDLEICILFEAYQNISVVAKLLGVSRNTVAKVLDNSQQYVKTEKGNYVVIKITKIEKEK